MTTGQDNTTMRAWERHIATPHGQIYAAEIPGHDPPVS